MKGQEAVGGNPARERRSRVGRVLQGTPRPRAIITLHVVQSRVPWLTVLSYTCIYIYDDSIGAAEYMTVHSVCMQGQRCKRRPSSKGQGRSVPACRPAAARRHLCHTEPPGGYIINTREPD